MNVNSVSSATAPSTNPAGGFYQSQQHQSYPYHPKTVASVAYPSSSGMSVQPPVATSSAAQAVHQQSYKVLDIGTQFCRQYYKMLSVEPEVGHKFYSKHSFLCHGPEGDLEAPLCQGLEEIQGRLLAMGFSGCRVFISTIDCQASVAGGVLMQVLGRMQMRGNVSRKFVQSIFLAEQPTGFFVMNDIFRFIDTDEAISPLQLSPPATATLNASPPAASVAPAAANHQQQAPVSAQALHKSADAALPAAQPSPAKEQQRKESLSWGDSEWLVDGKPPATPPAPIREQAKKKQEPVAEEEEMDQSKASWADITLTNRSQWGNGLIASESKGTSLTSPAPGPSSSGSGPGSRSRSESRSGPGSGSGPKQFKTASFGRPPAPSSQPQQHGKPPRPAVVSGKRADATATPAAVVSQEADPRPPKSAEGKPLALASASRRTYYEDYNPEASIYVGGLRQRADETTVRQVFSAFGEIKTIELASQCVFVEFVAQEAAQKAISASLHKLGDAEVRAEKRRPPRPSSSSLSNPSGPGFRGGNKPSRPSRPNPASTTTTDDSPKHK